MTQPEARKEDLSGLPVVVVEHSMDDKELREKSGQEGWKQLPDEIYRRYRFTLAKIEAEEYHVKVYAGKKTKEVVKTAHPEYLLKERLVSPSFATAVIKIPHIDYEVLYDEDNGLYIINATKNMDEKYVQIDQTTLDQLRQY